MKALSTLPLTEDGILLTPPLAWAAARFASARLLRAAVN